MSETEDDLQEAFAGESQANRKYLAFARQAEEEGYSQVAKLFRAAAQSETVHAMNHLQVMGGISDTRKNLEEAAEGESEEFREMYPDFVDRAKENNNHNARDSFEYAMEVEEIHHGMYREAIEAVEQGEDLPSTSLFVCQGCGNTVKEEPPDSCPVCGAPRSMFTEVE